MEIKNIPIGEISTSPMNPRKTFDEDALRELAENISHQGLLQPITIRPLVCSNVAGVYTVANHDIKYEIVCGERRFRAMSMLNKQDSKKWATISAIVRELTDDEAFDAMITENLQRKDVDPIEEAYAFGQLLKKGSTAEEVALRFGKSVRFVQDRVKLNNLIPELLLRVKEGTMAIAAGMIISKFDEEMQHKFFSAHGHYEQISKDTAQNFTDRIFMNINRSAWYQSDNQEDEDFEGGCGRKCAECQLNTANANCLFWEMKAKSDDGKCTHRPNFEAKHLAFLLSFLEGEGDNIVKKGEALEYGKTVIIDTANCWNAESQRVHDETIKALTERGYEIVKPNDVFGTRVYYSADDERIPKMLKDGEIYRCVDVLSFDSLPAPKIAHYYIKPISKDDDTPKGEVAPPEAVKLVGKYKRNLEIMEETKAKMLSNKASEMGPFETEESLCVNEQIALDAFIIQAASAKEYWERYGIDGTHYSLTSEDCIKIACQYPHDRYLWYREYLRQMFAKGWMPNTLGAKLCRMVMEVWDPQECETLANWAAEQLEKKQRNIISKLDDLGYDTEGRKLPK